MEVESLITLLKQRDCMSNCDAILRSFGNGVEQYWEKGGEFNLSSTQGTQRENYAVFYLPPATKSTSNPKQQRVFHAYSEFCLRNEN